MKRPAAVAAITPSAPDHEAADGHPSEKSLAHCARGWHGVVLGFDTKSRGAAGLDPRELERRLLEMGFIEGATVEVLHEGPFGRDPIAVRIDGAGVVALRRRDAAMIRVVSAVA
jgi:ferrous iron transport protein A